MKDAQSCFLSGCFVGYLPKAPGTYGTILGAVLALFLPQFTLFLLAILVTLIAIKQIDNYEAASNTHDESWIVIDEIVGIWIAISLLPKVTLFWVAVTVVLFRFFDITKPSYIKVLDKMEGGVGVMADDLLAGVVAGLVAGLLYVLVNLL